MVVRMKEYNPHKLDDAERFRDEIIRPDADILLDPRHIKTGYKVNEIDPDTLDDLSGIDHNQFSIPANKSFISPNNDIENEVKRPLFDDVREIEEIVKKSLIDNGR